ncbi:MAG: hypothetical protein HY690_17885 [Chloroflexi bacterium]|nr:hypothetical protein [Chloroflexota bacterium]
MAGQGGRRRGWLQALRDVLYGMTAYEFERTARERRAELEDLFTLVVFGDLLGLPILPSHYALRLLPYVVPRVQVWKRRLLREKDLTEAEELHLH